MFTTRRLGQQLLDSLTIGKSISIAFQTSKVPSRAFSFENLAAYSSQGPTRDSRIKPDLVAPGTIWSAKRLTTLGGEECGTTLMAVGWLGRLMAALACLRWGLCGGGWRLMRVGGEGLGGAGLCLQQ